jgi:tetratricopeptide (TPR) repeat protein
LGYYQYLVLRDYRSAKTTFGRVRKLLPGSSEVLGALGAVIASEGNWDESVAYFEQALALDPRDVKLLIDAAQTYGVLRQFPTALKLYDRALDITPNDPDIIAAKATICQAQGNLQEAAQLLSQVNEQTPCCNTLSDQLRLERNYGDAVRFLQTRLAQFPYAGDSPKSWDRVMLALTQRLAGDTAGAKVTAEQARNTLEQLYRDQPGKAGIAGVLSLAYAVLGEEDSAVKLAEHAIMLKPRAKDAVYGPSLEENLALIQAMFGQNSRAISTLTQLLQTPYKSWLYNPAPITSAHLRLDPVWDPLRGDPRFEKIVAPVAPK